jgi:energy-coupling factor transport system permease protein
LRVSQVGRTRQLTLVADSPLRAIDPRTKLFISVAVSLVVMLPLARLIIFIAAYVLLLVWARLIKITLMQVWRIKWLLIFLFFLDWWLISLDHATIICIRLSLLTGVFTLFFATTTIRELGLALESLRLPYRYAFSLSLAFQSLGLIDDEWRAIKEAQFARGVVQEAKNFRNWLAQISNLISLTVPAIVLTTKRAWSITEAAYARGFDSPHRKPYRSLKFTWRDAVLMTGILIGILLLYWR